MNRIFVVLAALGLALPSLAAQRQRYTITTDGAPRAAAMRIASHAEQGDGVQRVRTFRNLHGFAADLTPEEAQALRETAGVTGVDPVVERRISSVVDVDFTANLANYAKQVSPWGLDVIHATDVWAVTRGEGINVAVIDTGIDADHPDLEAAYQGGYNVLEPTKPPLDDNFHGTHVAGTIAAANNAFGIVGIAPGVKLWAVKALDQQGKGNDETVAAALDWVIAKAKEVGGRWVINMSFGAGTEGGTLERQALMKAIAQDIVLVAAAGNGGSHFLDWPASYPDVIPVGAVNSEGRRADFSAYGGHMAIVAPGVNLPSALPNGYLEESDIIVGDQVIRSRGSIGSPKATATGRIVYCQLGRPNEFPTTVQGNIALISRGDLTFREKSRNAKNAGATGVILFDDQPENGLRSFTLLPQGCPGPDCGAEWNDYKFPLTVNVSWADGQKLMQLANQQATVAFEFARYGTASGTSMASPHVASAAALLLALDPTLKPTEIATILRNTAKDTAEQGWDYETGWGIVDALAAAHWVAPEKFNVPPPATPSRRRSSRH
jgi:serine protease